MDTSLPPLIFTLHSMHGQDDYNAMARALVASELADGLERQVTGAELAQAYSHLVNCDPLRDLVLAEVAGSVVGYSRVAWRDEGDCRLYLLTAFLAPQWRRRGVGTAMLSWLENRAAEIAATHAPEIVKFLQANTTQAQVGAAALLEASGFKAVRYYFEMVRPNLDDIPEWSLPVGVEIRPAGPENYPAIWKSVNEAAQDEWGYTPPNEEMYQEWLAEAHFQPSLWQIAWDSNTEQVVGHVLTYIDADQNRSMHRLRGYTEGIGVIPSWRHRGLARALIGLSLQAQKAAGMSESALVVDADNPSEAIRLYVGCGFQVVHRNTLYRKPLNSPTLL